MLEGRPSQLPGKLAFVAWPLLVALACYLFPGPGREENYAQSLRRNFGTIQTPPTDQIGSGSLTQIGKAGETRIFWSQPEPGKVHGTIVIPAPEAGKDAKRDAGKSGDDK